MQSHTGPGSTEGAPSLADLPRQKISDGVGPLYHREYNIVVESSWPHAIGTMRELQADINDFSPQAMCRFEKTSGEKLLKVGDEFQIHITGPWNGPVRVAESSETSFTLATLEGHMEAGEIKFTIEPVTATYVRFKIESFARSKDLIVDFVYDKVPAARWLQTEMWRSVCSSVADKLRSEKPEGPLGEVFEVEVKTEKRDEGTGQWQTI